MTNAVVDQHTRWLAKRSTSASGRPAHPMVGVMVDQHMPDMTMTYAVVDQQTRWLAKRSTRTPDGWCGGRPAHARHDNDQRSGRPAHQMACEAVDQHKWSTNTPDGWRGGRPAHARHDNDQRSGRPAHQMACEAVDEHKWSTSTCQTSQ